MVLFCSSFGSRSERPRALQLLTKMLIRCCLKWEECSILYRGFVFKHKRTSPSHIRHDLISILIKSCSAQGCLDLLPKELQNKTIKTITRCKAVRTCTLMYFKLDKSLGHSSLNFGLELHVAMQLRKYI